MALLDPHPALKVAAPESPMVDGWMGDDWFHYGAFRQTNFDYFYRPDHARGEGDAVARAATTTITRTSSRRLGRRLRAAPRHGSVALVAQDRSSILPTMPSGRGRRSTSCMAAQPLRCRPCGFRACGTRKICGARFTATWPLKPKDTANDIITW